MKRKDKAYSALTAVFPNDKSIAEFLKDSDNRKRLQSFIDFAMRHGLIDAPAHEAFQAFIHENNRPPTRDNPDVLTIADLIDNKREHLHIKISNRALIDKINALLSKNDIDLPKLSSAMFTRIKTQTADTPRKRDALRSLAFWIGYERSDIAKVLHFETLKDLCSDNESKTTYTASGIRIAFSITSRGNIIGHDIITWMKKAIKGTFNERKEMFDGGRLPKVKSYDLTTFHVDLPNTDQSMIPSAYANTLYAAVSIAHQIAIRWIMSEFTTTNAFFSIGIAAGDFNNINNQLQAILNAKLPEDPVIRLTDYARQCVMINHIKILMNHGPREIELLSGETFKVWWITELSGMIYWRLVPGLISERHSEKGNITPIDIMRQVMIPGNATPLDENDAIICFLKFPHYPILGFEIVRTLLCRKMIPEALEILNVLLRVTPHHLNSRITRMILYKFLGIEAPDYYMADQMFRIAEKEAEYILENLNHAGEDFYYEYALVKLARLSTAIRTLRQSDNGTFEIMDLHLTTSEILKLVNQAEDIIMRGIIVSSPTFERILYLSLSLQVLKYVLLEHIRNNGGINSRLCCPSDKIKHHMAGVYLSWYGQTLAENTADLNTAQQVISGVIKKDDSMIAVEVFKPAQYFTRAVFYWDLFPLRNVAAVKKTLKILKRARSSADALSLNNEHIYSIASLSGHFVPANQFISQIDSLVEEIENRYLSASVLEKLDPAEVIGRADDDLVLMTYHV